MPTPSKIELLQAANVLVGTRAEVYATGDAAAVAGTPMAHPGWTAPPPGWDDQQPLLSSPWGDAGPQRMADWRGRAYFGYDRYDDLEQSGRGSQTFRSGFELDGRDIFDEGDVFELDLEYRQRAIERIGEPTETDGRLRLDRLAYGRDSTRGRPGAWRAGRFHQFGVPEFGVLDGVEFARLPALGFGYGASVGWMPHLYGDFETFQDLQAAAYTRYTGAGGAFDAGVGLQKTWDDGATDRDLVLLEAAWRPRSGFHAYGTAWLDYYGTDERVGQGSGFELTQAFLGAGWRGKQGAGFLASVSRISFPALTTDQGFLPPTGDPLDLRNDRLRLDAWTPLGSVLRAGASAWRWDDEEESGGGGELRLDAYRLAGGSLGLGGAVYADQGLYTDLLGVRLQARWTTMSGGWSLSWRGEDLESALAGGGGTTTGLHQAVRAGWDAELGAGWSLSLWYQLDNGADQDAGYGGFWLQKRF